MQLQAVTRRPLDRNLARRSGLRHAQAGLPKIIQNDVDGRIGGPAQKPVGQRGLTAADTDQCGSAGVRSHRDLQTGVGEGLDDRLQPGLRGGIQRVAVQQRTAVVGDQRFETGRIQREFAQIGLAARIVVQRLGAAIRIDALQRGQIGVEVSDQPERLVGIRTDQRTSPQVAAAGNFPSASRAIQMQDGEGVAVEALEVAQPAFRIEGQIHQRPRVLQQQRALALPIHPPDLMYLGLARVGWLCLFDQQHGCRVSGIGAVDLLLVARLQGGDQGRALGSRCRQGQQPCRRLREHPATVSGPIQAGGISLRLQRPRGCAIGVHHPDAGALCAALQPGNLQTIGRLQYLLERRLTNEGCPIQDWRRRASTLDGNGLGQFDRVVG